MSREAAELVLSAAAGVVWAPSLCVGDRGGLELTHEISCFFSLPIRSDLRLNQPVGRVPVQPCVISATPRPGVGDYFA